MAMQVKTRLTALAVRTAGAGRYADGSNLWLNVKETGSRSWIFRYMLAGRVREMGLGPASGGAKAVSLADAREKAAKLHKQLRKGNDPLERAKGKRKDKAAQAQSALSLSKTFEEACDQNFEAHCTGWGVRFAKQWRSAMSRLAYPKLQRLPLADITVDHILSVLEPIWKTTHTTATRLRAALENVLAYGETRGWRQGRNPAAWKDNLENVLLETKKVSPVKHHTALPWQEIGAFMAALRQRTGSDARALQLLVLCASRSGEVRGVRWSEIDLLNATWTVPKERMKMRVAHRVPLSAPALAVLRQAERLRSTGADNDSLVFPAPRGGTMSDSNLSRLPARMGYDVNVHGFRSTFRTWAAEKTNVAREIVETALAHTVGSKSERAYTRDADMLERRRPLMSAWAEFCSKPYVETKGGNVVEIGARSA